MLYIITLFVFLLFSLLLCMIVLAQESRSTGIGAAFGAEAASSLLGGSSAEILKKITAWAAAFFLFLCLFFSALTSSPAKTALTAMHSEVLSTSEVYALNALAIDSSSVSLES